jgi:hypothetical protein
MTVSGLFLDCFQGNESGYNVTKLWERIVTQDQNINLVGENNLIILRNQSLHKRNISLKDLVL